jgi:hypothetical protein
MDNQQTAIIKATYTRARGVAKANIRYIQHRKGLGGTKPPGNSSEQRAHWNGYRRIR